jgi:hypothetical protein
MTARSFLEGTIAGLCIPLHRFQHPDKFIQVLVQVAKQLDGPGSRHCTIG